MTTPAPPSTPTAALRVFDLAFADMLWSRRTFFMAFVVGGPVFLALLYRVLLATHLGDVRVDGVGVGEAAVFSALVWVYVQFTVPVLAVFYATALIADEVEDRTITYLFTRPIRRGAVLAGKYLAYLACTVFVVLPAILVVFFLAVPLASLGPTFPHVLANLGIVFVGLAAYGALFAWVGTATKRPLVAGLLFIFGWEPAVMFVPGYLKKLTVQHYLQALMPQAMPEGGLGSVMQSLFQDAPSVPAAVATLVAVSAAFIWLAGLAIERREYVLEQ